MIIIADIAGQLDALMRLVSQVPNDEKIILVGDLIDRGPYSADVVSWAMNNQDRVTTLMGNHEHMLLDYWLDLGLYDPGLWDYNGGRATKMSYQRSYGDEKPPKAHLEFLTNLPLFFQTEDLIVTHAAVFPGMTLEQACKTTDLERSVLWSRQEPERRKQAQIFGHNSHWGLRPFVDENTGKVWALCIDQSRSEILTAVRWPTWEVLEERYLVGHQKPSESRP